MMWARKQHRKGQGGEMIGLIVIVILLLVIVVIYMRFASKPPSTTATTASNIENQNLLMAIQDTTPCAGVGFDDAMEACADGRKICGEESCGKVKDIAEGIIKAYFGKELDRKPPTLHFVLRNSKSEILVELPDLKGKSLKTHCSAGYLPANKTIMPNLGNMLLEQCV